ncbi:MAG: threonine synthase [Desulfurococcaceae archaeon]|nr:threonine synthase [Desulfurococcaceae archaeon]
MSYLIGYRCTRCGLLHDPVVPQRTCRSCGGPLLAVYDIEAVRNRVVRDVFRRRGCTMWRYLELLPVSDERYVVSLGEGYTPLLRARRLGESLGLRNLLVKDEGRNPTGSFKDRPISVTVSALRELGVRSVAMPTSGNAGASLAAYGVLAGLEVHVAMPKDTPRPIYAEVSVRGVDVVLVEGLISDAGRVVADWASRYGWFDVSTMRVPYRAEGTKTMAYEVVEQLGWRAPDVVVFPTGGGEGVVGMWKGFRELLELGWVDRLPRMVVAQSEGCKPLVEAFRRGADRVEPYGGCSTVAVGIRVPKPFADTEILRAVRESGGTAVAVGENEILTSMREVASREGIFACPEGAAAFAATRRLVEEGLVDRDETVVVFNTGSGLKYVDLVLQSNPARR